MTECSEDIDLEMAREVEGRRQALVKALDLHPDADPDWPTIIQYVEQRTKDWKSSREMICSWTSEKNPNTINTELLWGFYREVSRMLSLENPPTPSSSQEDVQSHLRNAMDVLEGWDRFHTLPEVLGELLREDLRWNVEEPTPGDIVQRVRELRDAYIAYPELIRDREKKHRLTKALHHSQKALEHLIRANKSLWKQIPKEEVEEDE